MCGICGIFDAEGQAERWAPLLRQMNATLAHRGPDNDGFHISGACALGHRRLKIIDLSPLGSQPMTNEDETIWVSFNGEIYNYLELRPELVKRGYRFRSQSDTEVLINLYVEKGEDFLREMNGMFALALWDLRRERLLLARDRLGKKPLYYYSDGQRLLFGSEIKAILADPSVPREIDHAALSYYLALGYIPSPATIFRGIFKLPPASRLIVERDPATGRIRLDGPQRYWTLRYAPDSSLTGGKCVARIRELVDDAVRIRMYSDVPLGAFLSGGIDSSTVVASMSKASARPVETFSIGFDEESYDELRHAEQVAQRFRANHHTFRCAPDALEVLPVLVHHYDEPFADSSAVPTYYVSKIAREFVTVALAGDGGDEAFAGYTRYDDGMRRRAFARFLPEPLVRGAFRLMAGLYPLEARGWGLLHKHSLSPLDSYVADLCIYQARQQKALFESGGSANGSVLNLCHRLAAEAGSNDLLSQMQYMDQMLYLPEDILTKVDRASMAVSLEVRAPLLDYRIAEFMATVPSELRYKNGTKKYLLKKAAKGILPDEIVQRQKMGFGVPLLFWFRDKASDFAADTLLSAHAKNRGYFRPQQVDELLAKHRRGERDFATKIWALLFFELWCQHWLDRSPSHEVARAPASGQTLLRT